MHTHKNYFNRVTPGAMSVNCTHNFALITNVIFDWILPGDTWVNLHLNNKTEEILSVKYTEGWKLSRGEPLETSSF